MNDVLKKKHHPLGELLFEDVNVASVPTLRPRGFWMPWNEENPVEHHMYWPKEDVDVSDLIAEIEWDYDFEICWYWFEIDLKFDTIIRASWNVPK